MATGLTRIGEEFLNKYVFTDGVTRPSNVTIGLYNDATDTLTETDDISAITTEPAGSAYARQSASFPTDFTVSYNSTSENWEVVISEQAFDTSDSTGDIDSFFVVINFDSEEAGDGGTATDHLFYTGSLDQTYTLDQIDSFNAQNLGSSFNSSGN